MSVKKVCVVGAGAAGLAAIRHIKDDPALDGCVFEQTASVGGVWNYTDKVGNDEFGLPIHTTMYRTLRTNLPKEIMGYLDFPFPDSDHSYVSHSEVQSYLTKYSDEHGLENLIHFSTRVISIDPEHAGVVSACPKWKVKTEELKSKKVSEHLFDAVMICNGHYTKPSYPDIKNLPNFQGEVHHSRNYRRPEAFAGKIVVVYGAGPSAIDISLELADYAKQVILSSKKLSAVMPKEILTKSDIISANAQSLVTSTGEEIECDALMLCTGYEYYFPFLSPDCGVTIKKGKYVFPLYRHLINANFPSMSFIGIPFTVCPFPLFDCQIRYVIKVLNGQLDLPSKEEMLKEIVDEEQTRAANGIPLNHSHKFGDYQWEYNEKLAKDAGVLELIQQVTRRIYDRSGLRRTNNPDKFKNDRVIKIDSERFEYIDEP